MRIIDGHTHIGKWSEVFFNFETRVKDAAIVMKKAGVESAVCMTGDTADNGRLLEEIRKQKDFMFHFACWINPDDEGLEKFINDNTEEIKFFKIHPSFQRRRITDESYKKYLDIAESKGIPVIVHCGRWTEIAGYQFPLELAGKMPRLKIILAHLGGDQPKLSTDCANEVKSGGYKNVWLGTESVREHYFVSQSVKTAGPERIIFGSDYNLGLPQMYIPLIDSLKIPEAEKEMIFSGNILRLMNDR